MKIILMVMVISAMMLGNVVYAADPWFPVKFFDEETTVGPSPDRNTHQFPAQTSWELVAFGNLSTFEVTIDASIRCVPGSYHQISKLTETSVITNSEVVGEIGYIRGIDFAGYQCIRANLRSISGFGSVSVWALPREDSRN